MKYIIKTKSEGDNQVQILEPTGNNNYNLIWEFRLKQDSEPIILAEFYTEDYFVVINWDAWIRAYSVSKKELIFEKKYDAHISMAAKLSLDKSQLYLTAKINKTKQFLAISMPEFTENKVININNDDVYIDRQHFFLLNNNKVAYYFSNEKNDVWEHGFHVVNIETSNQETFYMDYPHWNDYMEDYNLPVLNPDANLGVMPCWDTFDLKETENGDPLFPFKVMLFNLDNFKIEKVFPIFDVPKTLLSSWENEYDTKAKTLTINNKEDEEFKDDFIDFQDNLRGLHFIPDSQQIWAAFSSGKFRKFDFEGNLSPIIEVDNNSNSYVSNIRKPQSYQIDGSTIKSEGYVIEEYNDYFYGDFPETELNNSSEIIQVDFHEFKENINISADQQKKQDDINMNIITVDDLDTDKSILAALDQLITITKNLEEARSGHLLIFKFRDTKQELNEEQFFAKAAQLSKGVKKIKKIIENFISYSDAERLYQDEETTALAYAPISLLKLGDKHLKEVISYLSVIDYEHDVICKNDIIHELIKYDKKHGKAIRKQLSKFQDGIWLEDYKDAVEEFSE